MIDLLMRWFVNFCLWLRYRIRVHGAEAVAARGRRGILFLPNHPALIDPIIVTAGLLKTFRPRPLADQDQIDRFFIRRLARRINVLPIPDVAKVGTQGRQRIELAMDEIVASLARGDNVLLYPAGHLTHQRYEDLGGAMAVEYILRKLPDVRVVLVRTSGLWGSGFSWGATGRVPYLPRLMKKVLAALLLNGIFFSPRRRVDITLSESEDLPRGQDRHTINRYLEAFYHQDAPPNTYVPYLIWEFSRPRVRSEPPVHRLEAGPAAVPPATRKLVADHLRELTGSADIRDEAALARDLGMDSLVLADLVTWLEEEFGFPQSSVDSLQTVGDVMLAACGEGVAAEVTELQPIAAKWFRANAPRTPAEVPPGETIPAVFLAQARRHPGRPAVADQLRGVRTYRDLVTAIFALRPLIAGLEGERIGILLPASVACDSVYLATLFAGKTPVMVNWTAGARNIRHGLDLAGVKQVLTAHALTVRLARQGIDLGDIRDRLVLLEQLAGKITRRAKLRAWFKAHTSWGELERAIVRDTAVVLFTSGSESLPKAVPLTHANILTNIRDGLKAFHIYADDRLLGMLPAFHSLGLTGTSVLPLVTGVPVVHHPNPNEGVMLARLIDAYRVTLLIGTPTFLNGIVRSGDPGQLRTLRLNVTGAEKCPGRVYDALARKCPGAVVIEGYGVTECSPIISANDENAPVRESIGKVLPSVQHAIVDVDTHLRAAAGQPGMLLVRGPSVFGGYLNYDGPSPFVPFEGLSWYRTGDLVSQDADGVLTFRGRLKRFVKLGGEMISLPAVEEVLEKHFAPPESGQDQGPVLAVQSTPDEEHPELVLFTTIPLDRQKVNQTIRDAGLSPLHNIRHVVPIDAIPLLGTGKTDYRELARRLESGQ